MVTIICGLIVPRLILSTFGSAQYGLTVSITQFLSFIALFEGGIGGVARARMYGPLAHNDEKEISAVFQAELSFFRHLGIVFVLYSIVLGIGFKEIAHASDFSRIYIVLLVMVISMDSAAKYFFGLPNLTLILADQRRYVYSLIMIVTTVANTVAVIILVNYSSDILWVKLGSSIVFVSRPVLYAIYTKKRYNIHKTEKAVLEQKWTGIGQHIAFYIHMNADIILLTLFADLKWVAVYSIYSLVITNIRAVTEACTGSMEATFGELIAKKQQKKLVQTYRKYTGLITAVTIILFSCTGILILDFVKLYTAGVTDTDYYQPYFAIIMIIAEAVNCLAFPAASLPIAANQLKQTRWGAYGEALFNIVISLVLIRWNPLIGVAIGTLVATLFRSIYYVVYGSEKLLHISVASQIIKLILTISIIISLSTCGFRLLCLANVANFMKWLIYAAVAFVILSIPVAAVLSIYWKKIKK